MWARSTSYTTSWRHGRGWDYTSTHISTKVTFENFTKISKLWIAFCIILQMKCKHIISWCTREAEDLTLYWWYGWICSSLCLISPPLVSWLALSVTVCPESCVAAIKSFTANFLFQLYGTHGWRKPRRFQTSVMTSFRTWCVWSQAMCPALSSCCQALHLKPARYYRSASFLVFDQTNHCHMPHRFWPCVHNYLLVLLQTLLFSFSRLMRKVSLVSSFLPLSFLTSSFLCSQCSRMPD